MSDKIPDTYTTQWESPSRTGGQWRTVVSRETYGIARQALNKLVDQRLHCRIVLHRSGHADCTFDERGPFNGPVKAADR